MDDPGQQLPLHLLRLHHLALEIGHGGGGTHKGDHHQIGRHQAVGEHVVELPRLVEDHLPLLEAIAGVVGHHLHLALVHI